MGLAYSVDSLSVVLQAGSASIRASAAEVESVLCPHVRKKRRFTTTGAWKFFGFGHTGLQEFAVASDSHRRLQVDV